MPVITEISLLLGLAALVSIIMRVMKQPLIVGYILTGILAGPHLLNLLRSSHELELFSKIGIIFLLFIVGLDLNPKIIREVGKVSVVAGIGQITLTTLVGFIIALALGIDRLAALYVAIALTFSSTIIILKMLSDKGDLEKLYAKIIIGLLLVQDIAASMILIFVGVTSASNTAQLWQVLLMTLLKGLAVFVVVTLISVYVLPRLTKFLASSQELLFVFSTAWAMALASFLAAIGFSTEIGALVAGVTLATTPFAGEMAARLKPLRDLFVLIFFILLGSQMNLTNIGGLMIPAIILSAFVLIGNPVIVIMLMNILGFSRKTGFMAGLAIAQISEFSLILAALAFQLGQIPADVLSLIMLVGLITISGSTYLILYADSLYPVLSKVLAFFELVKPTPNDFEKNLKNAQILLFGYDRVGRDFVNTFKLLKKPFLVVDYNPASIERLEAEGVPCRYGDASDPEFLHELPFDHIKLCVSTIPEFTTNKLIQQHINQTSSRTISVLLAHDLIEAKQFYGLGTSYVLLPHYLGAKHAASLIGRFGTKASHYEEARDRHLHEFNKRQHLAF